MILKSPHSDKTISGEPYSYAICMGLERGWYPVTDEGRRLPTFYLVHWESGSAFIVHSLSKAESYGVDQVETVTKEIYIDFCREVNYGI